MPQTIADLQTSKTSQGALYIEVDWSLDPKKYKLAVLSDDLYTSMVISQTYVFALVARLLTAYMFSRTAPTSL
jgi:hypothetical protein